MRLIMIIHHNHHDHHQAYTECLKFDPSLKTFNAQLYCNRAAAQLKKRNYRAACQDCTYAIHLDSTYLKVQDSGKSDTPCLRVCAFMAEHFFFSTEMTSRVYV